MYNMTKKNFDKKTEKLMYDIFESIDTSKQALKVYEIHAVNAPDMNLYKMQLITCMETNDTLDYLQSILASKSKFSKRVATLATSILNNNIQNMKKDTSSSEIAKTVIHSNEHLVKHLEKLKDIQ